MSTDSLDPLSTTDSTPIRRNQEPSPILAPVEKRFEHWGHEFAITHVDQGGGDEDLYFSETMTVTHVRTGYSIPFVVGDTIEDVMDAFLDQISDRSKKWFDEKAAEKNPVQHIYECPECGGTGRVKAVSDDVDTPLISTK